MAAPQSITTWLYQETSTDWIITVTTTVPSVVYLITQPAQPIYTPRIKRQRGQDVICGWIVTWTTPTVISQTEPGSTTTHTYHLPKPAPPTPPWVALSECPDLATDCWSTVPIDLATQTPTPIGTVIWEETWSIPPNGDHNWQVTTSGSGSTHLVAGNRLTITALRHLSNSVYYDLHTSSINAAIGVNPDLSKLRLTIDTPQVSGLAPVNWCYAQLHTRNAANTIRRLIIGALTASNTCTHPHLNPYFGPLQAGTLPSLANPRVLDLPPILHTPDINCTGLAPTTGIDRSTQLDIVNQVDDQPIEGSTQILSIGRIQLILMP